MPIPVEIPLSKKFSTEKIKEIEKYAGDRLEALVRGLSVIRGQKINQWRKIYNGIPRETTKSFPWQNASNVVIQLVGSFVDQLVAKIIMGVFGVDDLWMAEIAGIFDASEEAEKQRTAIQDWLVYTGLEPSHLNLIPKYTIWTRTFCKYGFGAIKILPEMDVEQVANSGPEGKPIFTDYTRHQGPVVHPIRFEDFLMPPTTIELERSPFNAQRAILERFEMEAMKHDPTINKEVLKEVLKNPTRQGPDRNQQKIEEDSGAKSDIGPSTDNWDVYECYYPYQVGNKKFRMISTVVTDEMGGNPRFLKSVFNWLPENIIPYVGARLGNDGERAYGLGFCEMLKDYQEEVTAIHNRRGDASTLANTNIFRIDTGQQYDSQFSFYPMATVPGAKDSIEVIPLGRNAAETIKDESMTLQLATDRAGVGPSSSGQGAGTVNKKGAYSAMGTFAVMQEGNTRANLNVTEFRQSHYTFGRLALLYYAHFGVPERDLRALAKQSQYLRKALDNYRQGRIILPIRAATGSVNKEIEKQNLMLLLNNTRAHWQMVNQLLQGLSNPMAPPEMQGYMVQVIQASNLLMTKICKDFGISDPSSILPEPMGIAEKGKMLQQAGGAPPSTLPNPQSAPLALPQPQAPGAPMQGSDQNTLQ